MGFFGRLFQRNEPRPDSETPEQRVNRLYRTLPQAASKLLVAGPTYGDEEYLGDVLIDSKALRSWAAKHAEGTYVSDPERQAAVEVLPVWLRAVDEADEHPTKVPAAIASNLRTYLHDFFSLGIAEIYCPKCGHTYSDMVQERHRQETSPVHSDVTNEWYCLKGHLLHRARSHTHFVRRRTEG